MLIGTVLVVAGIVFAASSKPSHVYTRGAVGKGHSDRPSLEAAVSKVSVHPPVCLSLPPSPPSLSEAAILSWVQLLNECAVLDRLK